MKKVRFLIILVCVVINVASGKEGSPEQQVDALVKQLSSEHRGTSFQDFFVDSMAAAKKPGEVKAMDAQAKVAWELYGAPESYEIFQRTEISKSLFRIRWITKTKDETPLFWSALFYRRAGAWEPLSLFFYDDPAKAGI